MKTVDPIVEMIEMRRYRLEVARNMHLEIQAVNDNWYQITDVHRVPAAKSGDIVRKTMRGWEVFVSYDATSPSVVLNNRSELINLDEEE
jgi:hypothetical protein